MNIKRFLMSFLLILTVINTAFLVSKDGCAKGWHKKENVCVQNKKQRIRILNRYNTAVVVRMQWIDLHGGHKKNQFTDKTTDITIESGQMKLITAPLSGYKLRYLQVNPKTVYVGEFDNNDSNKVLLNRFFVINKSHGISPFTQPKISLIGYKNETAYKSGKATNEEDSTDKEFFTQQNEIDQEEASTDNVMPEDFSEELDEQDLVTA